MGLFIFQPLQMNASTQKGENFITGYTKKAQKLSRYVA